MRVGFTSVSGYIWFMGCVLQDQWNWKFCIILFSLKIDHHKRKVNVNDCPSEVEWLLRSDNLRMKLNISLKDYCSQSRKLLTGCVRRQILVKRHKNTKSCQDAFVCHRYRYLDNVKVIIGTCDEHPKALRLIYHRSAPSSRRSRVETSYFRSDEMNFLHPKFKLILIWYSILIKSLLRPSHWSVIQFFCVFEHRRTSISQVCPYIVRGIDLVPSVFMRQWHDHIKHCDSLWNDP